MADILAKYLRISLEDIDKRTSSAKDESSSILSQRRMIQQFLSENKEFADYKTL